MFKITKIRNEGEEFPQGACTTTGWHGIAYCSGTKRTSLRFSKSQNKFMSVKNYDWTEGKLSNDHRSDFPEKEHIQHMLNILNCSLGEFIRESNFSKTCIDKILKVME